MKSKTMKMMLMTVMVSWMIGAAAGLSAASRAVRRSAARSRRRAMPSLRSTMRSRRSIPRDPLVSPAFATDAQLRRLPPVHILGADRDVLRDQGLRFARRLDALGCPVRAEVLPGSTHLFVTVRGQPAAFARAVAFAAEAMK